MIKKSMPSFDVNVYRHHADLRNMTHDQLVHHFHTYGRKEHRVYDIASLRFNWRFYTQHHPDLKHAGIGTKEKAISHFVNYGCKEFRKLHQDDMLYPSFETSRVGVFYAYYERPFDRKNQTNLMFFIQQTIRRHWPVQPKSIQFVFLINGEMGCSVRLPEEENVTVHYLPDVSSDFHAWRIGIEKSEIVFDHIVLMNCSCFGPVLDHSHTQHWLLPFHNRLVRDNAAACSPCISYLPQHLPEGLGPRLVSTFVFLRWTPPIQSLLTEIQISSIDESSTNTQNYPTFTNTVLGRKHDKTDAILTGEYGLSRILLQYGYKLTCLLYDDITDFDDDALYNMNGSKAPDRDHSFFGENIPFFKTIFIKTIWRSGVVHVSLPVHYHESISYMNQELGFTPILDSSVRVDWEYDALQTEAPQSKYDYFRLYGESEEMILFPKKSEHSLGKIAFVYASNDYHSLRTFLVEMVQVLLVVGYEVVISMPSVYDGLYQRHPSIHISPLRSDTCSPDDFWKDSRDRYGHYTRRLHLTDRVIFPVHGIPNMISQLKDLERKGNWKYSNDLFELCGLNDEMFEIDIHNFFASPFQRRIEDPGNGYEKYLKRFVS